MASEPNTTVYSERGECCGGVHEHAEGSKLDDSGRYLECACSTSGLGITFRKRSEIELVLFSEADYANKAIDRRSVSGGAIMCAGACGWRF